MFLSFRNLFVEPLKNAFKMLLLLPAEKILLAEALSYVIDLETKNLITDLDSNIKFSFDSVSDEVS